MTNSFWWQAATGDIYGPDEEDVFQPTEEAAQPVPDNSGAWHPIELVGEDDDGTTVILWRRCLAVFTQEKLDMELAEFEASFEDDDK